MHNSFRDKAEMMHKHTLTLFVTDMRCNINNSRNAHTVPQETE